MGVSNILPALPVQIRPGQSAAAKTRDTRRVYLVSLITEHRARLFDELLLARMVVRHLNEQDGVSTLAHVIMPDHLHWLLRLSEVAVIAAVVQSVKSSSARSINRFYGRTGRVWQSGFHEHPVSSGDDLKYIGRYIVCNPVRAGLAKSVRDYAHWDAIWL